MRLTELGESAAKLRAAGHAENELLGMSGNAEMIANVLATLGTARLITVDQNEVEVAHEALIREWPTLRRWLEDDREGLRIHRRLTETAREWDEAERKPSDLYRGTRLEQALEWSAANHDSLNNLERDFLDASQENLALELREKENAQNRARNRTQIALGAAIVAFAFATAVAWFWYQQFQEVFGEKLLQEARQSKENLNAEEAIAKFVEAATYPDIDIELSKEISNTLRFVATELVYLSEELARKGDLEEAEKKLKEALALDPPSDTPVYVWIEPGVFRMGSTELETSSAISLCVNEGQRQKDCEKWIANDVELEHTVYLDGYWIQRTEVTNEQYARCVESNICTPPGNDLWHQEQFAKRPVTSINWYQADTYARWVGGLLPTEAQWERACRGNKGWVYPWGNDTPR